jgi:nucleoside phosphorylase
VVPGKSLREMIGMVIPTRWEAGELFRRYPFRAVKRRMHSAQINGHTVLARISGVGGVLAYRAAEELIQAGAKEIISAGFCGALVPGLHVGDLVSHRLATVTTPVRTEQERRALMERANAVAADMETQAIVEAATRYGAPVRVLRVVSDRMTDDLSSILGPAGAWSALRVAVRLLNPLAWPPAWRLWRQSRVARRRLAEEFALYIENHP